MSKNSQVFRFFFILNAFFFATFFKLAPLHAQPIKSYGELPPLYQKAFSLGATLDKRSLEVFLETRNGYFVYKDGFKVESENFELDLLKETDAIKGIDPITKKLKDFYRDQNSFLFETSHKVDAPADLKNLVISLQACSKDNCLLPVKVSIPLQQVPAISADTPQESPTLEVSTESNLAAKIRDIFESSGGILSFKALLILFIAGLITAISPCVLPLFPLTLGIFARWSQKNNEKAFGLTLSYGAGIILFFAINGLISAATGGIFGSLTQNPYYLLTVGLITFFAGLMFSGLIPFPFANLLLKLTGAPDTNTKPKSYAKLMTKSFFMGATLGLVASPCVGPILLALLAWLSSALPTGNAQSYLAGFIALSIFGLGLALPFLILGHFYFRMHKRVQLGKFSPIAKYAGSLLLIASSFFFLVPAYKLFFKTTSSSDNTHSVSWENRPKDKWLVVDFRADWCVACIEIENEVLKRKEVEEYMASKGWVLVTVDMTKPEPYEKLASDFGVISLPSLLFINPQGSECKSLRLNEKESYTNFLKRLQSAETNCK